MKSGLCKAVALIALLGGTPAFAKTYDIAEITTDFSITGSIVTDGQFGVLSQADILGWSINIFAPGGTLKANVSSAGPFPTIEVTGSALTADNFGLFYNFSALNSDLFVTNSDKFGTHITGELELSHNFLAVVYRDDVLNMGVILDITPSGTSQFAIDPTAFDAIATPLPAALPLFATGLGALGLLGWRRKRKVAAF